MTKLDYILAILAISCLLFSILIYFYKKKYTREKFAFFGLSSIVTFGYFIVNKDSMLNVVLNFTNEYFNLEMQINPTSWQGTLLSIIVFISIIVFVFLIFENWDGGHSFTDLKDSEMKRNQNLVFYALRYLAEFFDRQEQQLATGSDLPKEFIPAESFEKLSWHEEVRFYLNCIDKKYNFTKEDWFSSYNLLKGRYGDLSCIVFCKITEQNDSDLQKIKLFIQEQLGNSDIKLIFAIKESINCEISELQKYFNMQDGKILFFTKEELNKKIIDFTNYREYLKHEFYTKKIANTKFSLNDSYVALDYEINNSSEKPKNENIEQFIYNWILQNNCNEHLTILGDYGQGKSVLCLKLANYLFENYNKYKIYPIIIELRGKSPRTLDEFELISIWASNYQLDPNAIMSLIRTGQILIIFDGFDEMDLVGDKTLRLDHFKSLWNFATYNTKIILTGRPNFFFDTDELKNALPTANYDFITSHTKLIYLQPLNKQQIIDSIKNEKESIKNGIQQLLENPTQNKNFIDLISRPSTLFLARIIWDQLKSYHNLSASKVIKIFMQHTYNRQQDKKIDSHKLTTPEMSFFMQAIAILMLKENGFNNQISSEKLQVGIKELLDNYGDMKINEKLPSDLKYDTLVAILIATGLLVNDLSRQNYFKFAHKSYFEFLVADFYVKYLNQNNEENEKIVNIVLRALHIDPIDITLSNDIVKFLSEEIIDISDVIFYKSDEHMLAKLLYSKICTKKVLCKLPKILRCRISFMTICLIIMLSSPMLMRTELITISEVGVFMMIPYSIILIHFIFVSKKITKVNLLFENACATIGISEKTINMFVCPADKVFNTLIEKIRFLSKIK